MMENNSLASGLRKTPIWPDYELTEYTEYDPIFCSYKKRIDFNSLVRKKGDDGLYYLTLFSDKIMFECINDLESSARINELIRRKIIEVYRFQICGIVNTNIRNSFDEPVFIPDDNQESEKERLYNLYLF